MMTAIAILVLAVGIYLTRLAGPVLRGRITISERTEELLSQSATVVLVALVVTSAVVVDDGFAGWALPVGVLVGGILACARAPFLVVVLGAAATTALLRLVGVS